MTNDEFQTLVLSEFNGINQRLNTMEGKIDQLGAQQLENTGFIQALLHQTEELNAKYDGLLNITVSRENFVKLEKKVDTLDYRTIEHDNDISSLKKVR